MSKHNNINNNNLLNNISKYNNTKNIILQNNII
jgi:hypothetical protein